jgi:glucosamine--fructose-6-phosphate aminotransferase (isomerizing)
MSLALITLMIGKHKGTISDDELKEIAGELKILPEKIRQIIEKRNDYKFIAEEFKDVRNFLYLGRGFNFPVALEGALKLKEISYIHAEGYPAAEMKHGPIALIDENMPVVFIAPKDKTYDKIITNIEEIKARKGKIITIATEDDTEISSYSDYILRVPNTLPIFSPILNSIPLQFLSYYIATARNCNVDQPRNLAKSVTVE